MQNLTNSPKVFVVEDDRAYADKFTGHLHQNQFEDVTVFQDAETASHHYKSNPDIIFLNFHAKGMNGLDVLKRIKDNCPETHIVLLSPRDKIQIAINAFVYGVSDYVTKGKGDLARAVFIIRKFQSKKATWTDMRKLKIKQKLMTAVIACLAVSLGILTWF